VDPGQRSDRSRPLVRYRRRHLTEASYRKGMTIRRRILWLLLAAFVVAFVTGASALMGWSGLFGFIHNSQPGQE
jgi:hypothetical protein